jgi:hypothetical protein
MSRFKTPQIKSPELKTPQFVQDVVRDLRDRRLLLPAIALLVALVAVPVLLASSSEPAPASPVAPPSTEAAEAVAPAVLAEQSGIRDYRKRLDSLDQKDPFDQKFAKPEPSDVAIEETSSGATSTGTSAPVSSAPNPSLEDALAQATGTDPASSGSSQPSDPGGSSPVNVSEPDNGGGNDKPEIRFVVGRVDVSFGPVGDAKEMDGVRELDFIPDGKDPIAAFIGLAGNGDQAVFGLTPAVVETRGEGSCSPKKPDPCQFLRLAEGESRVLKTSTGKAFALKLLETHLVAVKGD